MQYEQRARLKPSHGHAIPARLRLFLAFKEKAGGVPMISLAQRYTNEEEESQGDVMLA